MHAKTEELLYLLLWTAETLIRPTWRNMTESFEGWAYRNGLLRQLQRLERQKWLEGESNPAGDRLHRLTEAGRLQALGGRDPEACWRRRWDGRWRIILFDVPETRTLARNKLRRYLKHHGFGCLQKSVWITPDPVSEQRTLLHDRPVDVASLLLLEARPCGGESDAQIVAGAWDFGEINERYAIYQEVLKRRPHDPLNSEPEAKTFHRWLREERAAWLDVLVRDPLLPRPLLPEGYAGHEAWQARSKAMREAGEQMRTFQAEARGRDKK